MKSHKSACVYSVASQFTPAMHAQFTPYLLITKKKHSSRGRIDIQQT